MGMVDALRKMVRDYRFDAWLLSGCERDSGARLTLVYAGHAENKNYIANLVFAAAPDETYLGKKWLWDIRRVYRNPGADRHLLVLEIAGRLRARSGVPGYYVPVWVDGEASFADIARCMVSSERLKSDLRRVRKAGFTYAVTRGQDAVRDFYHRMYLPYTLQAHGDEAVPHALDTVMAKAERGDLLLVSRDGEIVAGEIVVYEHDGARFWCSGVVDGNYDHVRAGALAALYYYRYQYLSEQGYHKVHLGASRAFLGDGVLQYKKKWGQRIVGERSSGFVICVLQDDTATRSFLKNNPFLYETGDGLSVAVFTDADTAPTADQMRALYQQHYLAGAGRLVFNAFDARALPESIPDDLKDCIEWRPVGR